MRTIEFPYTPYKGIFVPAIPLQLKGGGQWFDLWAFVDSGATYSIFKSKEALSMNIDLSNAVQRYIVVGDGGFIPASFVELPIRIGEVDLLVEVGFSEKLGIGFNLLGRKNIFEKFMVCFSDKRKIISFHLDENSR